MFNFYFLSDRILKNLLFIFALVCLLPLVASTQTVEWDYTIESEKRSHVGHTWFDDNGDGYYNVKGLNTHYLLKLTADGKFNGALHIKNCSKMPNIYPFGEDNLISSGRNCYHSQNRENDTRLYSNTGQLLKTKEARWGRYFSMIKSGDGYYFMSKEGVFGYEDILLTHVDRDFNMTEKSVSIASMKKENLGVSILGGNVVQLKNKSFVAGFNYGKVTGTQKSGGEGCAVVGIKNNKINWRFERKEYSSVFKIKSFGNKVAIIAFGDNGCSFHFILLDQYGTVLCEKKLDEPEVADIVLEEERLLLLNLNGISYYSLKGELLSKYDSYLPKNERIRTNLDVLKNGDMIITGLIVNKKGAFITKLTFEDQNDQSLVEEEVSSVNVTMEEIVEEATSVLVYPNPASLYINFELEESFEDTEYQIEVLDASGRRAYSNSFSESFHQIELEDFNAGTYFFRIYAKSGGKEPEIIKGKFIKVE